jgi:agmatine deiminase
MADEITRRTFLGAAGAATLAGPAGATQQQWMLPEWTPHAACVMAWCSAFDHYSFDEVTAIRIEQAAIARAIATFEPVTMLVNPGDSVDAARQLGWDVEVLVMEHYDIWARDTLPVFGRDTNGLTATGWNFNTWGEKFEGYDADLTLAERFATKRGIEFQTAPIVAEGGAFETDGRGTLITTETCLLNPNRNPGLSRQDIEEALKAHAPALNVIWLWGSEVDDVTDGHVDGLARLIRPGLVVVEVTDDKEDPEYADLQENAVRLEAARDARGEPLDVIRLNRPLWENMPERGDIFAPSYVNSYFPNGGIIMPSFGDTSRDEAARALFAELEPSRRIVQLPIDAIGETGGGIHCCTMQIPKVPT